MRWFNNFLFRFLSISFFLFIFYNKINDRWIRYSFLAFLFNFQFICLFVYICVSPSPSLLIILFSYLFFSIILSLCILIYLFLSCRVHIYIGLSLFVFLFCWFIDLFIYTLRLCLPHRFICVLYSLSFSAFSPLVASILPFLTFYCKSNNI